MGRFFTPDDVPSRSKYPYSRPSTWDWHLGDVEDNFPTIISWYEEHWDWDYPKSTIPRVKIRRWCERNLEGDVLVLAHSDEEWRLYDEDKQYGDRYQVHKRWTEFNFEFESDAMAFKLKWLTK